MNRTTTRIAATLVATLALSLPVASAEPLGPGAPTDLAAAAGPGAGDATLSWGAASSLLGVSTYRVYRGADEASLALVAEIPADQLGYVDAGLANGATYVYAVSATDVLGEGARSAAVSVTTYTVPDAPAGLAVAAGPGALGEATLAWNAPGRDGGLALTTYTVYRDGVAVATLDAATTTWTDTGLTPLHAYSYSVSATNAAGEGPRSEETCGMASPWVVLPDGPACATVL
jgi:hypothetical protein